MPIDEQELRRFVESGELIPLLCAVAELTGDRALLDERFRVSLAAEMVSVPAHAGLDDATVAEGLDRAVAALARNLPTNADHAGEIPTADIVDFMTNADEAHRDLMAHEVGLQPGSSWTKDGVAPDLPFRVGIIGAGQAGLAMARELKRVGVDFVMFETADRVGGTWRWNAYPGCRLDTSTLAYSYSFFQKRDWRHYFAVRESLEEYYQEFAESEQLLDRIRFGARVESASWDDASAWSLVVEDTRTHERDTVQVDAVVSAVGFLNRAKIPHFDGLDDYQGQTVHSAEWDDSVQVTGKRVGIIGTGASAYQIAPAIVDQVESLTIFQRSAPWMLPAPLYQAEVDEGRRWLMENVPSYHRWLRTWEFWHSTIGKYALTKADPTWTTPGSVSESNQRFRDALVAYVSAQYEGREELLEAVVPTYPVGVKRMLRDNGAWAATVQDPRTRLVTTALDRFDRDGIRTVDGERHPADLTIFATGFHGTSYLSTVDIRGRDGRSLQEFWGDEARAYKGVGIPGFPNLFCLAGPNTGLVAVGSQTFMAECAVNYVSESLRYVLSEGAAAVEPTDQAYQHYIAWVEQGNRAMAWAADPEQSWYRNSSGTNIVVWPYPLLTYFELSRGVDPDDLRLTTRAASGVSA